MLRRDVPALDGERRPRAAQVFDTVRCRQFPSLAGHQRDVVVLPDDGQDLLAAATALDLQADEEGKAAARVIQRDVRNLFVATTHRPTRYLQSDARQTLKLRVVGEG